MSERYHIPCDQCHGRRVLWLGGKDYVECPMCEGLGDHEVVESRVQAKVQDRYIPKLAGGLMKQTKILLPHGWT